MGRKRGFNAWEGEMEVRGREGERERGMGYGARMGVGS